MTLRRPRRAGRRRSRERRPPRPGRRRPPPSRRSPAPPSLWLAAASRDRDRRARPAHRRAARCARTFSAPTSVARTRRRAAWATAPRASSQPGVRAAIASTSAADWAATAAAAAPPSTVALITDQHLEAGEDLEARVAPGAGQRVEPLGELREDPEPRRGLVEQRGGGARALADVDGERGLRRERDEQLELLQRCAPGPAAVEDGQHAESPLAALERRDHHRARDVAGLARDVTSEPGVAFEVVDDHGLAGLRDSPRDALPGGKAAPDEPVRAVAC